MTIDRSVETLAAFPRPHTRTSAKYEYQRARIIDAATLLLNRKGILGTTLLDVAAELGLTTTSVTYYFRRKDNLIEAVFEDSLFRLSSMTEEAGRELTPRTRVSKYVELYFDHFANALSGRGRPIANLSEIRATEEETRSRLLTLYRSIFRSVRSFFGEAVSEEHARLCTARAQVLNEALMWQEVWLVGAFAIGDLPNVRRRFLNILDGGLARADMQGTVANLKPEEIDAPVDQQSYLPAATRLINDLGYRGASIERIMGELKRSKGSFYHHLDKKDDLLEACWRTSYRRLDSIEKQAERRFLSPWARLTSTITAVLTLQFQGNFPLLRVTAYKAMPSELRDKAFQQAQRTVLRIMGQVIEAIQEGNARLVDPLIAGHLILSSVNAAYDLRSWRGALAPEYAVDLYFSVLAKGLYDDQL